MNGWNNGLFEVIRTCISLRTPHNFRSFFVICGRWIFRNLSWARPLFAVVSLGTFVSLRITRWMELGEQVSQLPVTSQTSRAVWTGDTLLNLEGDSVVRQTLLSLKNVYLSLSRRGGFVVSGETIVVQDSGLPGIPKLYFPNTDVGGIMEQAEGQVLLRRRLDPYPTKVGIFAGSLAPHNWFHWVIDTLPTLYLARFLGPKYASWPLLVPEVALERETWRSALELVAGGRDIVGLSSSKLHSVKNLVWLEGVSKAFPHSQLGPLRGRVSVSLNALLEYRDFVAGTLSLETSTPQPGLRIFLARRESEVRRYNQNEVAGMLENLGFSPVYLEDLGFEESLRVFREAEFIVGPHGAGWANMLFSTPTTKTLMWTWGGSYEDNWYQNIAFASGVTYQELHTAPGPLENNPMSRQDFRLADYYLPLAQLRAGLKKIGLH
jgi:hypothetical protein